MRAIYMLCLLSLAGCCGSPPVSPVTQLPAYNSGMDVTLSPNARIGNVTPEDISFVRKALAAQNRCQVDGPIIAIGRDVVNGKHYLSVMTARTMFTFIRSASDSWKLDGCGPYNY